jgi:hypothetical protein
MRLLWFVFDDTCLKFSTQENEADAESAFDEIANFIGAQRELIAE